jgi:hypothetical protein
MKKNTKVFMVVYGVCWVISAIVGMAVYLRWLKEYTESFKDVNRKLSEHMKDKFILSNDDDIWDEEQKKHILEWREVSKNLEGITKKYYSE